MAAWASDFWCPTLAGSCGASFNLYRNCARHLGTLEPGRELERRVSVKADHLLIRSGPYAHVRRPIYAGLLLAVIGTAVVIGEWRGLLAILIWSVGHTLKAKREEAVMIATFGDQYQRQRTETRFLLPRL